MMLNKMQSFNIRVKKNFLGRLQFYDFSIEAKDFETVEKLIIEQEKNRVGELISIEMKDLKP